MDQNWFGKPKAKFKSQFKLMKLFEDNNNVNKLAL